MMRRAPAPANSRAIAIVVPISGALRKLTTTTSSGTAVVHRRASSRRIIAASASTPTRGTVDRVA